MPWKFRGRRKYFYQSVRHGQRVDSVYLGSGYVGQLAASMAGAHRARRDEERSMQQSTILADQLLQAFLATTDGLLTGVLLSRGYYRHDRGEWRRRRGPHPART